MPTFNIEVKEKNRRRDGRYPVSIRVTHMRKHAYISTRMYVSRGQVDPDSLAIKDNTLNRALLNEIHKSERILFDGLGISTYASTAQRNL